MSQLTKGQLQVENQTNFPNNTTGYITPSLLRQFNDDMIQSLALQTEVDAISSSVDGLIISSSTYATTGSNTFNGNQVINGNVSISSSNYLDIGTTRIEDVNNGITLFDSDGGLQIRNYNSGEYQLDQNANADLTLTSHLQDIHLNTPSGTIFLNNVDFEQYSASVDTRLNNAQGVQGTTGAQGGTGTQGATGQSIQGSQGTTGNTGAQGSIGIQGTTGAQGLVGNQGVQGIKGNQGTQAAQGTIGSQGGQGATGAGTQGADGAQGATGSQGGTGTQGAIGQGVQGTIGSQGVSGSQGGTGTQGSTGAGTQGIQGQRGTQGATGTQGSIGVQGSKGDQGIQGGIGLQGFVGNQGVFGYQGVQGISGAQGVQGIRGLQGTQGIQGTTGQGTQGSQGIEGSQGAQGVTQDTGSFATTGSNTFIGEQTIVGNVTFPSGAFISTTNTSGSLWISSLNGGNIGLNADGGEGDVLVGYTGWNGKLKVRGDSEFTGSQTILSGSIAVLNNGNVASLNETEINVETYTSDAYGIIAANNHSASMGIISWDGATYDNELWIQADNSGIQLTDWDNGIGNISAVPFLSIGANDGSQPAPQFGRGLGITGSMYQSGTFYADGIDVSLGGIIQNTGSYVATFSSGGVLTYDTYQNVATALQPYILTGSVIDSSSFITTGSVGQTQSITGSLDVRTITTLGLNSTPSTANTGSGTQLYFLYNDINGGAQPSIYNIQAGWVMSGSGITDGIVTAVSGDDNGIYVDITSGNVVNGDSYIGTGPFSPKLIVSGGVYTDNGFVSPGGLIVQNEDGSGGQYGGVAINCTGVDFENIFSSFTVFGDTSEATMNLALSSYSNQYNGKPVPMLVGGGYYTGQFGSSDTAITFYSSSIQNWKPTQFKAPVEITGSLKVTTSISASTFTGLGNLTTYSSSVNSRLLAATGSAGAAFTYATQSFTGTNTFNNPITASKILLTGLGTTAIQYNQPSTGSVDGVWATSYGKDTLQVFQYQSQPYAFNVNLTANQLLAYTGSEFQWGLQTNGTNSIPGGGATWFSLMSGSTINGSGPGATKVGLPYLQTAQCMYFNADTSFARKVYINNGLMVSASNGSNTASVIINASVAGGQKALEVTGSVSITGSLSVNGQSSFATTGANTFTGNQIVSGSITIANASGQQLYLPSGSNRQTGTFVLDGGNPGTATISNSQVTANSLIFLTKQSNANSGNGTVSVTSKGSGTFSVTSDHNGDADTVAYMIINPS